MTKFNFNALANNTIETIKLDSTNNTVYLTALEELQKQCENAGFTVKTAKDTIRVYSDKVKLFDAFRRRNAVAIHTAHEELKNALNKLDVCIHTDFEKYTSYFVPFYEFSDVLKAITK